MDMDPAQVAMASVTFLAPFLPYLVDVAKFSAEAIAEMVVQKGAEGAWQQAQAIWARLRMRFVDDGVINGATEMLAAQPGREDFQAVLAAELAVRLEESPDLTRELLELLGGQKIVQKILAERGSWVERVQQKMEGAGTQIIHASDDSVIIDAKQNIRGQQESDGGLRNDY